MVTAKPSHPKAPPTPPPEKGHRASTLSEKSAKKKVSSTKAEIPVVTPRREYRLPTMVTTRTISSVSESKSGQRTQSGRSRGFCGWIRFMIITLAFWSGITFFVSCHLASTSLNKPSESWCTQANTLSDLHRKLVLSPTVEFLKTNLEPHLQPYVDPAKVTFNKYYRGQIKFYGDATTTYVIDEWDGRIRPALAELPFKTLGRVRTMREVAWKNVEPHMSDDVKDYLSLAQRVWEDYVQTVAFKVQTLIELIEAFVRKHLPTLKLYYRKYAIPTFKRIHRDSKYVYGAYVVPSVKEGVRRGRDDVYPYVKEKVGPYVQIAHQRWVEPHLIKIKKRAEPHIVKIKKGVEPHIVKIKKRVGWEEIPFPRRGDVVKPSDVVEPPKPVYEEETTDSVTATTSSTTNEATETTISSLVEETQKITTSSSATATPSTIPDRSDEFLPVDEESEDDEDDDLNDFIASLQSTASPTVGLTSAVPSASLINKPKRPQRVDMEAKQVKWEEETTRLLDVSKEEFVTSLVESRTKKVKEANEWLEKKLGDLDVWADGLVGKVQKYFVKKVKSGAMENEDSKVEFEKVGEGAINKVDKEVAKLKGEIEKYKKDLEKDEQALIQRLQHRLTLHANAFDTAMGIPWSYTEGVTRHDWTRFHALGKRCAALTPQLEAMRLGTSMEEREKGGRLRKLQIYEVLEGWLEDVDAVREQVVELVTRLVAKVSGKKNMQKEKEAEKTKETEELKESGQDVEDEVTTSLDEESQQVEEEATTPKVPEEEPLAVESESVTGEDVAEKSTEDVSIETAASDNVPLEVEFTITPEPETIQTEESVPKEEPQVIINDTVEVEATPEETPVAVDILPTNTEEQHVETSTDSDIGGQPVETLIAESGESEDTLANEVLVEANLILDVVEAAKPQDTGNVEETETVTESVLSKGEEAADETSKETRDRTEL